MTTATLPSANRLPHGYAIASTLSGEDRGCLEILQDGKVIGDAIAPEDIGDIVEDIRGHEALGHCDNCGRAILPGEPSKFWPTANYGNEIDGDDWDGDLYCEDCASW